MDPDFGTDLIDLDTYHLNQEGASFLYSFGHPTCD